MRRLVAAGIFVFSFLTVEFSLNEEISANYMAYNPTEDSCSSIDLSCFHYEIKITPANTKDYMAILVKNDPDLLWSIYMQENGGNGHWDSKGNVLTGDSGRSIGAMQIGPYFYGEEKLCGNDVHSLEKNIICADKIITYLLAKNHGNVLNTIQKYNGSGSKAKKYAKEVIERYKSLKR